MNDDEIIISEILGMRDLLYSNIIDYKEYQTCIKDIFKQYNLKYKFIGTIYNGKTKYEHIGCSESIIIAMPVNKLFIDWNIEHL